MSLTTRYAEALFPNPVRIFGRRLHPYCIGHALLLHRVGNPMAYGQTGGIGDLLSALYICSRPWQKALAGLNKRRVQWLLRRWGRKLSKPKAAVAVGIAEQEFSAYITRAWDGPDLWEKPGRKRHAGCPTLTALKVSVQVLLHRSEEEALSTPVRAALFDCAAWREVEGLLEWVSDEELDAIESVRNRN